VPIGETLAQARQQAGLTVTQVSERTRIREPIIRAIEGGDYAACGGDFYARGNIRSIAKAIGADAEPLIREYDSVYRAPGAVAAVSLDELLAASAQNPRYRGPDLPTAGERSAAAWAALWRRLLAVGERLSVAWAVVWRRLAGLGQRLSVAWAVVWRWLSGVREGSPAARAASARWLSGLAERLAAAWTVVWRWLSAAAELVVLVSVTVRLRVSRSAAVTRARRRLNQSEAWGVVAAAWMTVRLRLSRSRLGGRALPAVRGAAVSAYPALRRHLYWAVALGVALVVLLGFGVYRAVSGSPQAAVAPPAAGRHANPAPGTGRAAGAPAPAVAAPAQRLVPVSAAAFGPGGGDNPQLAAKVIGGHGAAGWHTDWYSSARFGNLYQGTGLLLDMGRPVTVTAASITLGSARGASLQLRVGAAPALTDLPPVARISGTGGVVRLRLARPAQGRYVLIWFTRLPRDRSGTFQAGVYHVSLEGRL
jgi:transcriptional regulator with XRE-family HTH domain